MAHRSRPTICNFPGAGTAIVQQPLPHTFSRIPSLNPHPPRVSPCPPGTGHGGSPARPAGKGRTIQCRPGDACRSGAARSLLSIRNLSKTYPNGVRALRGVSLEIPRGMFGLVGPNGAGKSTLMRTIATLQEADEGAITFGEIDVLRDKEEVRKILGYLPQEFGVYPRISVAAMLDHFAVLKAIGKARERKEVVVILSTHIVDDVSDLCQRMAIISEGQVRLTGDPRTVVDDLKGKIWRKQIDKGELEEYRRDLAVISTRWYGGRLLIHVFSHEPLNQGFEPVDADLKDVYFSTLNLAEAA